MAKQEEMEKKILRILQLPKAVTRGLIFHDKQLVVRRYHEHDGPKRSIKMIPDEARRRSNQGGSGDRAWDRYIYLTEPTSPTVSCMGQIKNKKHQRQHKQHVKKPKSNRITLPASPLLRSGSEVNNNNKKRTSMFQRILQQRGRKSSRASFEAHGGSARAAPALSQVNRFASRRGALYNFDWKAQAVVPEDDDQTTISFSLPTPPASI